MATVLHELATCRRQPISGTEQVWTLKSSRGRRIAFLRHGDDGVSIVVRDL